MQVKGGDRDKEVKTENDRRHSMQRRLKITEGVLKSATHKPDPRLA